jgi:hypothetical protein
MKDLAGRLTYGNAATLRIIGRAREALPGRWTLIFSVSPWSMKPIPRMIDV